MSKKMRKTLNVSLQSKKYSEPINRIINQWDAEGSNTSAEVCEIILLFDKYDKSITLSNVKNVFELVQKMAGMYMDLDSPETNRLIEEVLREVIFIDNSKLSGALASLNEKLLVNSNKTITSVERLETSATLENRRQEYIPPKTEQTQPIRNGFIPPNEDYNNSGYREQSVDNGNYGQIPRRKSVQQNIGDNFQQGRVINNHVEEENLIPMDFLSNS